MTHPSAVCGDEYGGALTQRRFISPNRRSSPLQAAGGLRVLVDELCDIATISNARNTWLTEQQVQQNNRYIQRLVHKIDKLLDANEAADTKSPQFVSLWDKYGDCYAGVLGRVDPNWDTVKTIQSVSVYHLQNHKDRKSSWVRCGQKAVLRFERGARAATIGKKRILLRGSPSTPNMITMNVAIDSCTKLPPKKDSKDGVILLFGVNDKDRGYELFKIRAEWSKAEEIHAGLRSLAA